MKYKATSPEDYISQVPEERQDTLKKLRKVIKDNLPKGFEEGIQYKMIGYYVPHSVYPDGYHCDPKLPLPCASIANQKNFIAFYHMAISANKELNDWFVAEYPKHSKFNSDMGQSCVRLTTVVDIPYELIDQVMQKLTYENWVNLYDKNIKK